MTQTNAATTTATVVETYFAMWNETDPARRQALIEAAWTPDASYLDPMFTADGPMGWTRWWPASTSSFPNTASG